jgi:UDP-N-acetylglucosamine--N-acetylmuramyl-(pentapeptide) pyrophosphoryl-undecaprenol N-acetylglucosamine transferase
MSPESRVLFLCSDREIDRKVLEPEGVAFKALPAKPIAMGVRKMWRFISSWPGSVRATRAAVREARAHGPVHMVAMGGFVAAPAVQGARAEGVPITLVNLDAAPGKANRWIAKRIGNEVAFTTVADAAHPKWTLVAPIVRSEATATRDKAACRRELGLDADKPVLMITGGSQGATSINLLMTALVKEHAGVFKARGWQVLHQTGRTKRPDRPRRTAPPASAPWSCRSRARWACGGALPTWPSRVQARGQSPKRGATACRLSSCHIRTTPTTTSGSTHRNSKSAAWQWCAKTASPRRQIWRRAAR